MLIFCFVIVLSFTIVASYLFPPHLFVRLVFFFSFFFFFWIRLCYETSSLGSCERFQRDKGTLSSLIFRLPISLLVTQLNPVSISETASQAIDFAFWWTSGPKCCPRTFQILVLRWVWCRSEPSKPRRPIPHTARSEFFH